MSTENNYQNFKSFLCIDAFCIWDKTSSVQRWALQLNFEHIKYQIFMILATFKESGLKNMTDLLHSLSFYFFFPFYF